MTLNKKRIIINKENYKFYILIKKWYEDKTDENLNKCILFYLDNYEFSDANVLFLLKYILENYTFYQAVKIIFLGSFKELKK